MQVSTLKAQLSLRALAPLLKSSPDMSHAFDAGSSIGANLEESKASYSRRELAANNAISLKESRESKYWLRVAAAKSLGKTELRERLLQESDEFVAQGSTRSPNSDF